MLHQGLKSADMICMGVGDEDGGEVVQSQAQFPEGGGDPTAGDAGIDQQVRVPTGADQGISRRAAGQSMYGDQRIFPRFAENKASAQENAD